VRKVVRFHLEDIYKQHHQKEEYRPMVLLKKQNRSSKRITAEEEDRTRRVRGSKTKIM
jgi:hypothetical protein